MIPTAPELTTLLGPYGSGRLHGLNLIAATLPRPTLYLAAEVSPPEIERRLRTIDGHIKDVMIVAMTGPPSHLLFDSFRSIVIDDLSHIAKLVAVPRPSSAPMGPNPFQRSDPFRQWVQAAQEPPVDPRAALRREVEHLSRLSHERSLPIVMAMQASREVEVAFLHGIKQTAWVFSAPFFAQCTIGRFPGLAVRIPDPQYEMN